MKAIKVKTEAERAGVHYVRTEAMVMGFGISPYGEFADDKPDSEYVLVTDDNDKPLSTCRIVYGTDDKGERFGKIERVATVSYARGIGAGRIGIEAAEEIIKAQGVKKIIITSRDEAQGFYEKLGYTAYPGYEPEFLAHGPHGELPTPEVIKSIPDNVNHNISPENAPKPVTFNFTCVYMEKNL